MRRKSKSERAIYPVRNPRRPSYLISDGTRAVRSLDASAPQYRVDPDDYAHRSSHASRELHRRQHTQILGFQRPAYQKGRVQVLNRLASTGVPRAISIPFCSCLGSKKLLQGGRGFDHCKLIQRQPLIHERVKAVGEFDVNGAARKHLRPENLLRLTGRTRIVGRLWPRIVSYTLISLLRVSKR